MLKPVYALVGDDAFLQLEEVAALLHTAPPDTLRIDIDGEAAELADVLDELRSFAMFGGGKIVVVRDGDDFVSRFRESLEKYVAAPSNSATLVLRMKSLPANQRIHKLIAKVGQIIDCKPPKQLARWIMDRGKNVHALTIGFDVAELLANLVGENLGRLDSELAKLALVGASGRLTMADITGTVAFQKEQKIYEMTNALSAGNIEEAVRRWRQLLQTDKSAEFRGITWICLWLESVRRGIEMQKRGIPPADIARDLRIWQRDTIPSFMRVCQAMGGEGVTRAMAQLAEIDYQSKTGVGDAAENVERFLLSLQLA